MLLILSLNSSFIKEYSTFAFFLFSFTIHTHSIISRSSLIKKFSAFFVIIVNGTTQNPPNYNFFHDSHCQSLHIKALFFFLPYMAPYLKLINSMTLFFLTWIITDFFDSLYFPNLILFILHIPVRVKLLRFKSFWIKVLCGSTYLMNRAKLIK